MKKYNGLIVISVVIYCVLAFLSGNAILSMENTKNHAYRIESYRIMEQLKTPADINGLNMNNYQYIQEVEFLSADINNQSSVQQFFAEDNNHQIQIIPFYQDNQLQGYMKFIYQLPQHNSYQIILILEISLFILEIFILSILIYVKRKIVQPFQRLSHLPLQLAKGHLKGEVKEEKSKYFGQFMWGMGQLKDTLDISQKRQLELMKEKKKMILSLSHDMKTPLNLIKLYSKALQENVYSDQDAQIHAMKQISEKTEEIEKYIGEIIQSSREDIIDLQVYNSDFYLNELMNKVLSVYQEQCDLRQIELTIDHYENRLLKGDIERSQEVFENLFENALKYGDGRRIEISFDEEDYCQLIRIYNTGEPVTDTEFHHLFESFYRGGNSQGQQGNGLGLYICRELMRKMDGALFAEKYEDGMAFVMVFR